MSLSFNKHNEIITNDIVQLTKNDLNNVVPEELFDDLEIVYDDPLEEKLTAMSQLKLTIKLR